MENVVKIDATALMQTTEQKQVITKQQLEARKIGLEKEISGINEMLEMFKE